MKKEIAEMQKILAKRSIRDSELRSAKDRLKAKSKQLLRNIEIGLDMSIDDFVNSSRSPPRVQMKPYYSARDTKSSHNLVRGPSKFRFAGSNVHDDPIDFSLRERVEKGGSHKSIVLHAISQ